MKRVHVSWYNRPRRFDNGVVWFHVSVRFPERGFRWLPLARAGKRWHNVFGMWFSRGWPFLKISFPWSRNLRISSAGPPPRVHSESDGRGLDVWPDRVED